MIALRIGGARATVEVFSDVSDSLSGAYYVKEYDPDGPVGSGYIVGTPSIREALHFPTTAAAAHYCNRPAKNGRRPILALDIVYVTVPEPKAPPPSVFTQYGRGLA